MTGVTRKSQNVTPIESALVVDKLVRPTLRRLDVKSLEELARLDIEEIAKQPGIGSKKLELLGTLIVQARSHLKSETEHNHDDSVCADSHVPGLADEAELLFVPSLLKPTFQRDGITTVQSLLAIDTDAIADRAGWGKRKIGLLIATQRLYRDLATARTTVNDVLVDAVIPAVLLPDDRMRTETVREFLQMKGDQLPPESSKRADFEGLKRLLLAYSGNEALTDNAPHYLRGFEHPQMDWRDVPLDVSKRVADLLERFQVVTVADLDRLASTGHVVCPDSQQSFSVLDHENFGEASLENLRNALLKLNRLGLNGYRRGLICELEQLPPPDTEWRCIPLKLSKRLVDFLDAYHLRTLQDLHRLAVRAEVFCPKSGHNVAALEQKSFSEASLTELRRELMLLAELGIDKYRYGDAGKPRTASELADQACKSLLRRDAEVLRLRCGGMGFAELAEEFTLTKQRVQQMSKRAITACAKFKEAADDLLTPVDEVLDSTPTVVLRKCLDLAGAEERWQFALCALIAGRGYEFLESGNVSRFSSRQIEALDALVRDAIRSAALAFDETGLSVRTLVDAASDKQKWFVKEWSDCVAAGDVRLSKQQLVSLIGLDWLRMHVRSQLVDAGVNGLFVDQLDTIGLVLSADELTDIMHDDVDRLPDGRLRRPGDINSRGDEIVAIVRSASTTISSTEIASRSQRSWHQSVLVGRYLSALHEIVMTDRGLYLHIDKLSLTVRDVTKIAAWGAELLAGEQKLIDGRELFDLYQHSDLGLPLENAHQLVSIVAKHPEVRRISNNLQLAHRDSFDESELYLAVTDPDLAAQWHPDKNGKETPETVRPTTAKTYWWRCELGHEFEASPVYRTRMIRTCPGCQERWTLTKIRHFVRSLQKHLDTFTPAELYVIFQQSGLWQRGGKAKGFVKALATGRFPRKELDRFANGEKSLVDEFLDEEGLSLDQPSVLDDEKLGEKDDLADDSQSDSEDDARLPQVRSKGALEALDSHVIASTDAEAAEFLLASAKAKIWSHAYRDDTEAVEEVEKYGKSEYAEQVRLEFLQEYEAARELIVPDGYAFTIDSVIRQPNLMQRHVATQVRDRLRFGNWSGTGAGKTLSAILATRVTEASLTVVCCPNAVVGDNGDGWAKEIIRVYPDSDVVVKTLEPTWSESVKHRYLVLNFEYFQQPNSEALLKQFLSANTIDFVVIDEVHYAKQRFADQMSQRKRLLQALVSIASETNPDLRVLGMSATPVINNLQEGRSLVEMITGVEHDDLDVKPTVPNCMRLHQKLATLGTRWRPTYSSTLEVETVDVDCSEYLPQIRALGKSHSPLDLEKILTQARLPVILDYLSRGGRSLVYTHYVSDIDRILYDAISDAGYRAGFYTGDLKDGLSAFKDGKLDVLIGSSSVGTGVDGLQHCCNQLIINVLPWTNAEYEQLIGRLWRQGQGEGTVNVVIPVTFADIHGERWSYCDSKLRRIRYKKSIADAAVDGAVPEGNLRTAAQAQRDIMAWLERLEHGKHETVIRRKVVVPLSDDAKETQRRLGRYGDFSRMNNRWNQSHSQTLGDRLAANPEEWEHYHTLYRQARSHWATVPINEVIAWCEKREGYEIGDFGCGEALLAEAVGDRHTIHSFDHVAINDSVIEGDMSHTPLSDCSLDVAVFSLSLMGSNFTDYLREAHRVLKIDGQLHIWEATSRFNDVATFCNGLEAIGFRSFQPQQRGQFTHIQAQKTDRRPDRECQLKL